MLDLVLDCDGVCADWTDHLLRTVGSDKTLADITAWEIKGFLTPEQWATAKTLLAQPDWWAAQPVIDGAIEGVAALRSAGYDIHWATSPWHSCREWEATRRDWLRRNFDVEPHDITFTYRKDRVVGHAIIDDKAEHVRGWVDRNFVGKGLLFDAPYNRVGVSGISRVTWATIPQELEQLCGEIRRGEARL